MPNRTKVCLGFSVLLLAAAFGASATPYVPQDDAVVLEVLPTRPGDPAALELRRLRAAAAAAPTDAAAGARLARRYFDMAMAEGDPRYVGYAEAALRAWPETAATSAEILVLHGMLRQYRHDFARGWRTSNLRCSADPANTEARAWRAAIRMVQADYAGRARRVRLARGTRDRAACDGLHRLRRCDDRAARAPPMSGSPPRWRDAAASIRNSMRGSRPGSRKWPGASATLAAAERHFRKGLALGVDDNFLLAAYADFLLEHGRAAEVMRAAEGLGALRHAAAAARAGRQDARAAGGREVRAHAGRSLRRRGAARREAAPAGGSAISCSTSRATRARRLRRPAKTTVRSASRATRWS